MHKRNYFNFKGICNARCEILLLLKSTYYKKRPENFTAIANVFFVYIWRNPDFTSERFLSQADLAQDKLIRHNYKRRNRCKNEMQCLFEFLVALDNYISIYCWVGLSPYLLGHTFLFLCRYRYTLV